MPNFSPRSRCIIRLFKWSVTGSYGTPLRPLPSLLESDQAGRRKGEEVFQGDGSMARDFLEPSGGKKYAVHSGLRFVQALPSCSRLNTYRTHTRVHVACQALVVPRVCCEGKT